MNSKISKLDEIDTETAKRYLNKKPIRGSSVGEMYPTPFDVLCAFTAGRLSERRRVIRILKDHHWCPEKAYQRMCVYCDIVKKIRGDVTIKRGGK